MKKLKYEQAVQRLEEIVSLMENNNTPLDESIELYKEGIELAKFCDQKLSHAEGEISILKKTSQGLFQKKPFIYESDDYNE